MTENMIDIKYGEKKFEPIKYWISEEKVKWLFFFTKTKYYLSFEFGKFGPFDTHSEAMYWLSFAYQHG